MEFYKEVIKYFKTNSNQSTSNYHLKQLYDSYPQEYKQLTPLTEKQQITFDNIFNSLNLNQTQIGGLCYIYKENFLVENIKELSFTKYYPHIIKLLYQNKKTDDKLSVFSYIIDNHNNIKDELSDSEYNNYNSYINSLYGYLPDETRDMVTLFAIKIFENILDIDICNNVYYIDTDTIYYFNDDDFTTEINKKLNGLIPYIETIHQRIYFISKKKYIYLNDDNITKGILVDTKNRYKKERNITYQYYLNNFVGEKLAYNVFNATPNIAIYQKYKQEAIKHYIRSKKFKILLEDE